GRNATELARVREAGRLLPVLADVNGATAEAEDKSRHPPPRPFPWAWATAGTVTLLSLGAWGGLGARRWWRNRFRIHAGGVIDFLENGRSPVLLDVRSRTDYETSPLQLPEDVRPHPTH